MKVLKVRLRNEKGNDLWEELKVSEASFSICEVILEEQKNTTKILDILKGRE